MSSQRVTSWRHIKPAAAACSLIPQISECTDDFGRVAWFLVLPVTVPRHVRDLLDTERPVVVRDVPRVRGADGAAYLKPPAIVTLLVAGDERTPILVLRGEEPETLCAVASLVDTGAAISLLEQVDAGQLEELDPVKVRLTTTRSLASAIFGKGAA